jgi:hypothetical protein
MTAIHFLAAAILAFASATALAAEPRCKADDAGELGLAAARALVGENCRSRLQALGAPERWFDECPGGSPTPVEREMLARTSVSFARTVDQGRFTRVELLFRGPDAGTVLEKMERTKDCRTQGSGTEHEPLAWVPAPCKAGFWEDIPITEHKGVIPLACTEAGKWRIVSPAEMAPAKPQPAKAEPKE